MQFCLFVRLRQWLVDRVHSRWREGKIVNDKKCVEQVKQILESTPRFDILCDRGACVLDVDVSDGVYVNEERRKFESDSGISFPVIRKEYCERALSQTQQDHERQQRIQFNEMSMVRIKTHMSRSR